MILDSGTITPEAAKVYDAACRETAKATEAGRRLVNASLSLQQTREAPIAAMPMGSDKTRGSAAGEGFPS